MNLKKVLQGIDIIQGPALQGIDISGLAYDSRKVKEGTIFFAIKGFIEDGRKYIKDAFQNGATFIIVDDISGLSEDVLQKTIFVTDVRLAMAAAAANYYDHPTTKLKLFGVTGTNGKSSCGQIMAQILSALGHETAVLGTIECRHPGKKFVPERTTMESLDIQEFLADAVKHKCTMATIEVSAHAMSLHRINGCQFAGVLFTNLTPDHEDFYRTMEDYFSAKKQLFTYAENAQKIVNIDDKYGKKIFDDFNDIKSFSVDDSSADYYGENLKYDDKGIFGTIIIKDQKKINISTSLVGRFNRENIIASVALLESSGINYQKIEKAVKGIKSIPGRLEKVKADVDFSVFVDFAHSGGALDNLLDTVLEITKKRLILVFGAGGDKDPMRRVHMGKIAANRVDIAIITSDNPRFEDPAKIISEIEQAFDSEKTQTTKLIIPDRAEAIRKAIELAQQDDVVVVTGKGHEEGQTIKDKVIPFSDKNEILKSINEVYGV